MMKANLSVWFPSFCHLPSRAGGLRRFTSPDTNEVSIILAPWFVYTLCRWALVCLFVNRGGRLQIRDSAHSALCVPCSVIVMYIKIISINHFFLFPFQSLQTGGRQLVLIVFGTLFGWHLTDGSKLDCAEKRAPSQGYDLSCWPRFHSLKHNQGLKHFLAIKAVRSAAWMLYMMYSVIRLSWLSNKNKWNRPPLTTNPVTAWGNDGV